MELLYYPNKALTTVCEPVTEFGEELTNIVEEMTKIMTEQDGLGLAAPQVGVLGRFFVATIGADHFITFVNPEITDVGGAVLETKEGCLSLPDVIAKVKRRYERIMIKAQDLKGEEFEVPLTSKDAIICSHEMDHLEGKTLFQTMNRIDRLYKENSYLKRMKR